jgi:glycosyltransferase involved in cell wall biosynthesis
MMKVLWLCGLPRRIQDEALKGEALGSSADWSWVLGHLPPPSDVELHIACPVTKGPWKTRSVEFGGACFHLVRCLPGRVQTGYLLESSFFAPLVRRLQPALIHGWGTESSFGAMACGLSPRHHVVQVQGLINAYLPHLPPTKRYRYLAWRERRTLARARHVFVESGYSLSITKPYCGKHTQIYTVDHPLRSEFLNGPASTGNETELLFLGSLENRKGYLEAVRAFAQAATGTWRLTLIGGGDPDVVTSLHRVIADSGAADRISHQSCASVQEVVEKMRKSSVFLLPSHMDTGPTALKEALAMGLWPVCYDNSGPREFIKRFEYGSLARTGSIEELTLVLKEDMRKRPWQHPGRGDKVVRRVREALNADKIWGSLIRLYEGIVA